MGKSFYLNITNMYTRINMGEQKKSMNVKTVKAVLCAVNAQESIR